MNCICESLDNSDRYITKRLMSPIDAQDKADLLAWKKSNDEFRAHLATHEAPKV